MIQYTQRITGLLWSAGPASVYSFGRSRAFALLYHTCGDACEAAPAPMSSATLGPSKEVYARNHNAF
jgi:hypothetical protein